MADELLEIADELYALPLPDFTPARDARAKELKAQSDTADLAAPVKALRKPSLAAWVLNLFVRREAAQVEQVFTLGESLREAQAAMSGEDLRALTRQRRQLTAAVTQQARTLAKDEGVKVTQAVADQVEATLTAGLVDAECARAVRSGLLVTSLSTTGVGAVELAGAVALPDALGFTATPREAEAASGPTERPELRVVPDPDADAKARAAAEEARDAAQEQVDEAKQAYDDAHADVETLEARTMQLQAELDELKRRLGELETASEQADDELTEAEDVRAEASDSLKAATQERDRAVAALAKLG
ncbi:MAG: hypothetical protein WKF79_14355 [Nocardioides sp.]